MPTRTLKLLVVSLVSFLIFSCSWSPRRGVVEKPVPDELPPSAALVPVSWQDVEGWLEDDPSLALDPFIKSCSVLHHRQEWQRVCGEVTELYDRSDTRARDFFERNFVPYQLRQRDKKLVGLSTGYYVPDLRGSRKPSPDYPYPLYRRPEDLLVIDLQKVYPELGRYRLRGRLEDQRVIPYWNRAEIDGDLRPLAGSELLWVDDPVELFFLHIQGSGRILFEDGSWSIVHYDGQNGHPYSSISEWLIKRDIMTRDEMSMPNIKAWAQSNPSQVYEMLNTNPSYVFFSELPGNTSSVTGALGVPLTPGRSVAVDRRYSPLGAPVFMATTWPESERPLYRLMMAQDTGGAIKGPVRADFFWGFGDAAGMEAGRMKQPLKMWVLLPRDKPGTE